MLRRPALLALVCGTVAAMASASHVDVRLVASATVYWSFVPAVQCLIAWALVASAPRRVMPVPAAIDAFFTTSLPWSLWMIAFAGWSAAGPPVARSINLPLLAALIPLLWTPWLIFSFCRRVLGDDGRTALRRTLAHQAASWLLFVAYYGSAVALWPRIVGWYQQGAITI
jgi:hypothetical protein